MELTPKSMSAPSPPFRSAPSHSMALNALDYPTPPYNHSQAEAISSQSPPALGLGIMNSDVESYTQIEIYPPSQQHQLQPIQRWPQECTPDSSHGYSTLSSTMSYTSSPMFSDLGGLPSVSSSPYGLTSSQAAPTSSTFLSPNFAKTSNDRRFGEFPSPYNHIPRSRPVSPPKEVTRVKEEPESGWPSNLGNSHGFDSNKESSSLASVTQAHGGLPSPYAMSSAFNQATNGMLYNMNQNIKQENASSQASHGNFASPRSSSMSGSLSSVSGPPVYAPKPRRRTTPENAKQACPVCGMLFTRSSNCTAHMETHNPERKRPHKCTMAPCKKKFSRKTDLIRHVDSVHHKIKRYGCDLCGQRFARGDTLRRHRTDGCRKRYRNSKAPTSNPPTSTAHQEHPTSVPDTSTQYSGEQHTFPAPQLPLPDYYDSSRSYIRTGYMSCSP